jgi:ribosome biogenesis protein UTP30
MPVDLSDPAWAESAREAARCVELRVEGGTCRAVRVGHGAMAREEAVENVVAAVEAAAACVPRKWRNVRALHVKSPESTALPLYSAPGTGGEGNGGDGDLEAAKPEGTPTEEQGRTKRHMGKTCATEHRERERMLGRWSYQTHDHCHIERP